MQGTLRKRNFRDRIVGGSLTLPATFALAAAGWMWPGFRDGGLWGGLAATGLTAYLIVEWNNRNALLRIRSRLTSCVYLLLMAACPFLHRWTPEMATTACLAGALILLFASYQKPRAEGEAFHAFLCIGVGSLFFPPVAATLPLLCFSMAVQMRSLTLRAFLAGLTGLLLPYWAYAGWAVWNNRLDEVLALLPRMLHFERADYSSVGPNEAVAIGYVAALVLLSILHYLRTAYNDKIRTRMCFYALILQVLLFLGLMAVQPQWHAPLLRLLLVPAAPLMAHYLALARGRFMNAWFAVVLLSAAALAAYNYVTWKP